MTREDAVYILQELKSIRYYRNKLEEIRILLQDLTDQINDIQTPHCPLGGEGIKIENHKEKSTIVNGLLSDEQALMDEQAFYIKCLARAEGYYKRLQLVCNDIERAFSDDFINGEPYRHLEYRYGYSNVYDKMIRLISRILK